MIITNDTIAAIATPPGEGGIAVIRISGPSALQIADQIFSGNVLSYKSHTAHFGFVLNKFQKKVDEALLLVMRAPRSYTGDDIVEIQCHGGTIASTQVLQTALDAGARLAGPGEFTYRAYMNGKLDLAQAEAVQALISAKSQKAFDQASSQLEGALSKKIRAMNEELLFLAALFEAWVDFPEEGLEFLSFEEAALKLKNVINAMTNLLQTFHDGEKWQHGLTIAIIGAPNVGKSSLMNALMEKEKAIVTDIAGTTRDLIEGEWIHNGLFFRLIDTAGIRDTDEVIEKEGIRRTHQALEKSDLILLVFDANKGIKEEEELFLTKIKPSKTIAIWNKSDLIAKQSMTMEGFAHTLTLSAKNGIGIGELKEKIYLMARGGALFGKDEVILTSYRHKEALTRAKEALERSYLGMQNGGFQEILAFELRQALMELGTILGNNVSEDILSSIFSNFCIGK